MLDIEIVNNEPQTITNRKAYIKKQFEIKAREQVILNKLIKLDKVNYYDNKELVKELIDKVVDLAFAEGQTFGTEKVVYKERENEGENQMHYKGTKTGRNRTVY